MLALIKGELRDMRRNLLNSTFVMISLCVGVMSVLVTHQLSLSIIERLSSSGLQGAYDYVVYLPQQSENAYFDIRRQWRSGLIPNVTHVVPIIEGMLNVDGKIFDVLGYDPIASLPSANNTLGELQPDPRFMTEDSVIAIDSKLQLNDRVHGSVVVSVTNGRQRQLIADLPTAQRLLNRIGELDAVWLKTRHHASPWWDRIVPGLMAASSSNTAALSISGFEAVPFAWWNPSQQLGEAIVFNLGMLSLLTLLVAGFIVFQAMQSNLRNRATQVELFDVLGLTPTEQRLLVLLQCVIFGFAGCVFGVLTGVAGLSFLTDATVLEAWHALDRIALWKAVALGFVTSITVGVFVQRRGTTTTRYVSLLTTLATLGGIAYGLWDGSGLLGASLLSVCFCLLSIFCVVPLAIKTTVFLLRKVPTASMVLRMNLRNALDTVTDIRLAINALSIAVATAIGIGLMLDSFRGEFTALLDQRLVNDLHLFDAANFDPDAFALRADVESIRTYYRGAARVNDMPIQLIATELDVVEFQRYGYNGDTADGVFIDEVAANNQGFRVGDAVSLNLAEDPETLLRVLHIYKNFGEPNGRVIAPRASVNLRRLVADQFSIDVHDASSVRMALAKQYPEVTVVDNEEIRAVSNQLFNASFATAQVMVNVAIFVAVMGMACALIGMQVKRLKEMRLLTMMGTSRARLAWNSVVQNALIGLFAVVVALPLSLAIAWNLCYFVTPRAYGWAFDLVLSWEPVLLPVALGVLAALLAGLEPLRRTLAKVISQPISNVR